MYIPTQKLRISNLENWDEEIRVFAEKVSLIDNTRQPCFEVWYPPTEKYAHIPQLWDIRQKESFDAIEYNLDAGLDQDPIKTLPPYTEMRA